MRRAHVRDVVVVQILQINLAVESDRRFRGLPLDARAAAERDRAPLRVVQDQHGRAHPAHNG